MSDIKLHKFFEILNQPNLSIVILEDYFSKFNKNQQIFLIKEYFSTFPLLSDKKFNIDNTLDVIQELNKKFKLDETINQTLGLAYDILSKCDTLKYLQWAVEKMHINPLSTSESRKVYIRPDSTSITNPTYITGEYMSVLSINTGNDSSFLLSPTTAPKPENLDAIKEEVIYKYIGKKNKKDLISYLLSVGCAKDILDKNITFLEKIKHIPKNAIVGAIQLSTIALFIYYCFFNFEKENILSIIFISAIISLLASWHYTYTIYKQFAHVKKHLLNMI